MVSGTVTARSTVVSTEASTHGPHYKTVLLLPRMTMQVVVDLENRELGGACR